MLLTGVVLASTPPPGLVTVVAGAVLVTPGLVVADLVRRRLPDRLVALLGVATLVGLVVHGATDDGTWPAVLGGAAAGLGVLVVGTTISWWGGLGMGDVKLAAVLTSSLSLTSPGALLAGAAALVVGCAAAAVAVVLAAGPAPHRGVPLGPVLLAAWWVTVVVEAISASAA
jgi:leader peptidase (prepilin peptidase)/N-methyltransferase